MVFVVDAGLIFCSNKVRQQVVPVPALCASGLPVSIILAVAPNVNHAIDGGRASQNFAPRHHETSAAGPFFRLGHVAPRMLGAIGHSAPTRGHADHQIAFVAGAAFHEQDAVLTAFSQSSCQLSTGRA